MKLKAASTRRTFTFEKILLFTSTTVLFFNSCSSAYTTTTVSASPTRSFTFRGTKTKLGSSSSVESSSSSSEIETKTKSPPLVVASPSLLLQNKMKPSLQEKLTNYANSYAAANGLQVETKTSTTDKASYQCAPISLLPNAFPYTSFQMARTLAPHFNVLVDKISMDGKFLVDTLSAGGGEGGVTSKDPYTKNLLDMYQKLYMVDDDTEEYGKFAREADRLGILRSDYMLNQRENGDDGDDLNGYELKQVELNTIASSFAGLSVNVAGLHTMLSERFNGELKEWFETNKQRVMGTNYKPSPDVEEGVPPNPALSCLPQAMNVAHEQYKKRFPSKNNNPVVLFVVQEGETNTVDQRMLEFNLWKNHHVPVVRMSLTRAHSQLRLDEKTGTLFIQSSDNDEEEQEVSLVYFRAGYAPTDFPDGDGGIEWQAREIIERARATKCPNLGYHLAGTKKVQQELARPGALERFFGNDNDEKKEVVSTTRGAFAGLYALGDDAVDEDKKAVIDAITGGEGRYVLKPQREGGGYNYYSERLATKLKENTQMSNNDDDGKDITLGKDLAEFILMQRLFPPQQEAVLLRGGKVEGSGESISEFGCFGTIVATHDGKPLHNVYSGFLLRTKFSNVDEGGVASGFATLSSPYLC
jgi:glutathione synthetase